MKKKMGKKYYLNEYTNCNIISIFLIILLILASCGENIETTKNNRIPQDEIIIGMTQEPDSLDPVFSQMAASSLIQGALFEAETERNEKWDRELR
ncbi:MAG: hypothetical protein AB1765_11550, partial [Candidatus Hydrogenedentota bacterium]